MNFQLNIPITKVDKEKRMVWGWATSEDIDSQGEIVDYNASKKAFDNWGAGNIRLMHDNKRVVGKKIDTQYDDDNKRVMLGAYVSRSADGENAWTMVKEGILTGFSIGGKVNATTVDKVKSEDGEKDVVRLTDYDLVEVSLVDNPANPTAKLIMVKSFDGEVREADVLERVNDPHKLEWWRTFYKYSPEQEMKKTNSSDNVNKRTFSDSQRKDLADSGQALPDGSFPIVNVTDLKNAIKAFGRAKDPAKAKAHIIKRARALGRTDLLPADWNVKSVSPEMMKSVADASWLSNLGSSLVSYIQHETDEGDNMDSLHNALSNIQAAVAQEVQEGDDFEPSDDLYDSVELAAQVTNMESSMKKDDEGTPDVETDAVEETPVDETDTTESETTEEEATEEFTGEDADVDVAEGDGSDVTESADPDVTAGSKATFTKNDVTELAKAVVSEIESTKEKANISEQLEKAMSRIEALEAQVKKLPAATKAKASYVVDKVSDDSEDSELDKLKARADELANGSAEKYTGERGEVVNELLKAARRG